MKVMDAEYYQVLNRVVSVTGDKLDMACLDSKLIMCLEEVHPDRIYL